MRGLPLPGEQGAARLDDAMRRDVADDAAQILLDIPAQLAQHPAEHGGKGGIAAHLIRLRERSSPAASASAADSGMRTTTSGAASSAAGRSCPSASTLTVSLAGNTSSAADAAGKWQQALAQPGLPAQQMVQRAHQLRGEQRGRIGQGSHGRWRLAGSADYRAEAAMQGHHAGGEIQIVDPLAARPSSSSA